MAFEVDDSIGIWMFAFEVCRNFGSMSFCRVFPRKNFVYVVHDSGKSILGLDIDVDALTTWMTGSVYVSLSIRGLQECVPKFSRVML